MARSQNPDHTAAASRLIRNLPVCMAAAGPRRTAARPGNRPPSPLDGSDPHPRLRLTDGTIGLGHRDVEVLDLVAATLRRVAEEATRVGGQPADDVALVVPATWGPARRTLLRRAATRAALPQPRLVESPVAVAPYLLARGPPIPVG